MFSPAGLASMWMSEAFCVDRVDDHLVDQLHQRAVVRDGLLLVQIGVGGLGRKAVGQLADAAHVGGLARWRRATPSPAPRRRRARARRGCRSPEAITGSSLHPGDEAQLLQLRHVHRVLDRDDQRIVGFGDRQRLEAVRDRRRNALEHLRRDAEILQVDARDAELARHHRVHAPRRRPPPCRRGSGRAAPRGRAPRWRALPRARLR